MDFEAASLKMINLVDDVIQTYEFNHNITLKNKEIAKIGEVTDDEISRFRNGKKLLKLDVIIKIIRKLSPSEEITILKKICGLVTHLDRPYIIREAMEVASTSRLLDCLKNIVDHQLINGNKENKEWARVYDISYHYQRNIVAESELLSKIDELKPSRCLPKILLMILKAHVLNRMQQNSYMKKVAEEAELLLNQLNDNSLVKRFYKIRIYELKAYISMNVLSEINDALYYANKVISSEICSNYKVHSYYVLGQSNLFTDFDVAMKYFRAYHDKLQELGRNSDATTVKEQDMVFARIVHGRDVETLTSTDISEIAHLEARWGDKEKALKLIDQAEREQGNSVYKDYYRSLAENDPSKMFDVLTRMIDEGKKFFAHLVARDLEAFGKVWAHCAQSTINNIKFK